MIEKVIMPQLGESVTEGTVSQWLVSVGDEVKKYEPICEVTTDKVNAEVPSMFDGKITEIVAQEGETVSVGSLICYMEIEGGTSTLESDVPDTKVQNPKQENKPVAIKEGKQRLSPAVLKLANKHKVDLTSIQGTGAGGRITRKDILIFVEKQEKSDGRFADKAKIVQTAPPVQKGKNESSVQTISNEYSINSSVQSGDEDQILPVTSIRKTIANRMVQSKHEAPHAWIMVECDVTNLVNYREQIKDQFKQKEGINLTYLSFFIKSVVEALKEFPLLNSQWKEDQIIVKKAINISIAVATEDALFVPVIKDADQKNILGLARAIEELATKTREGKLTQADMAGGTFTVNNTGSFGSVQSSPIINSPQAAILSVEAIVKRPVVIENMIAVRDMMNICLSLDHRVLDGLVCGRFLQAVKKNIESYGVGTKIY